MKQIDYDMAKAFAKGERKSASNTTVMISNDGQEVYLVLHGNAIVARKVDSEDLTLHLPIRWQTQTTKSRINAVLEEMNYPVSIKAIKGIWYFILPDGNKQPVQAGPNFIHK